MREIHSDAFNDSIPKYARLHCCRTENKTTLKWILWLIRIDLLNYKAFEMRSAIYKTSIMSKQNTKGLTEMSTLSQFGSN